jgi:integrase
VEHTDYYVPFFLAALSLRRSEICALDPAQDLHGNELTISRACVRGVDGYVIKNTPKTDASYRTIQLPAALADRIRSQGYVYRYNPNQLDKTLHRVQKKLGIPSFSIHKFRHFFASYAHDKLKLSDAQIQKIGGWSSDVMKRVYRHAMNEDEAREMIADRFSFCD